MKISKEQVKKNTEEGEYCGTCGKEYKTTEEHAEAEKRCWFCSEECDNASIEREYGTVNALEE
jgi:hypothetical protein